MARSIGHSIPEQVRALMAAERIETLEGFTFLLLTTGPDGWPHQAMLSVGEVLASGQSALRLALWPNSTATGNLSPRGRATLTLVHQNAGYSIRLHAERGEDLHLEGGGKLAYFDTRVEEIFEDIAPYAFLDAGIQYRLKDPSAVLPRWRATVAALRAAPDLHPAPGA